MVKNCNNKDTLSGVLLFNLFIIHTKLILFSQVVTSLFKVKSGLLASTDKGECP